MVKILKMIAVSVVIILILFVVGIVIAVKTVDLNQFRGALEENLSRSIGAPVELGKMSWSASWKQGVALDVRDVQTVFPDASGTRVELTVGRLALLADLRILVLSRRIQVQTVEIEQPFLVITRGVKPEETSEVETPPVVSEKGDGDETTVAGSPDFLKSFGLELFRLRQGNVRYVDSGRAMEFKIRDLAIEIEDFQFGNPFSVLVTFLATGYRDPVTIQLKAQVRPDFQEIRIHEAGVELDVSVLNWSELVTAKIVPERTGMKDIAGVIKGSAREVVVEAGQMKKLDATLGITGGAVPIPELAQTFKDIQAEVRVDDRDVVFSSQASLAGGQVLARGEVRDWPGTQKLAIQAGCERLSLPDLLAAQKFPVQVRGWLNSELKIQGEGVLLAEPLSRLTGSGRVWMDEGRLVDVNILALIVNSMAMVPGARERLDEKLSSANKKRLQDKDTLFEEALAEFQIAAQRVQLPRIRLVTQDLSVAMEGSAGFDLGASFQGRVLIPRALTTDLVAAADRFAVFQNTDGQLELPLQTYQGPLAVYKPQLDFRDVTENLLKQELNVQLHKVLQKVTGHDETISSGGEKTPSQDVGGEEPGPESRPPEEILLEGIMDSLFRKR